MRLAGSVERRPGGETSFLEAAGSARCDVEQQRVSVDASIPSYRG